MWKAFIFWIIKALFSKEPVPQQPQVELSPEPPVVEEEVQPAYVFLWNTKEHIRKSIRVICDEKGLNFEQKNTMCATIYGESEFVLTARNDNKNGFGKITSTDWGLCQWNSYWHGKEITPDEAVHNPEKAVRLMADYWKLNKRDLWIAYKSGRYKSFMAMVQRPM